MTTRRPTARRACCWGSSPARTRGALGRLGAAARRRAVLGSFVRLFGAAAARPRTVIEHNWSDEEWTRGCYAGYLPPGVWSDYGPALREPVGRDPLGRHRDLRGVQRLHGRRRALRRARRRRGPPRALRARRGRRAAGRSAGRQRPLLDVVGLGRSGERARQAELVQRRLRHALDAGRVRRLPACGDRRQSRRPRPSARASGSRRSRSDAAAAPCRADPAARRSPAPR